jgi:hypothetical protein
VQHEVYSPQSALDRRRIGNVANEEIDVRLQIRRPFSCGPVNLRGQIVQQPHLITGLKQEV